MNFPKRMGRESWGLPAELQTHPYVLGAILRELGMMPEDVEPLDWAEVRRLAEAVTIEPRDWDWQVRLGRTRPSYIRSRQQPAGEIRGWLRRAWQYAEESEAALLLATAWRDPELRRRMDAPAWTHLMRPLTQRATVSQPALNEGWLRAHISTQPPFADQQHEPLDGALTLKLIRVGRRGEALLKPVAAPHFVEGLRGRVQDPRPEDEHVIRLAQLRRLTSKARGADDERRVAALDHAIFAALGGLKEVVVHKSAVTVMSEPWPVGLVLADGTHAVDLKWRGGVKAWWDVGVGYVLDDQNQIWPIPVERNVALRQLLRFDLPSVEVADLPAFLDTVVARSQVPIEVRTERVTSEVGEPHPAVRLTDHDGVLSVELAFTYAGTPVEADGGALLVTEAGVVRRDFEAEVRWREVLVEAAGGPVPATLEGDAAFDFLFEALPRLEGWSVHADRSLLGGVRGVVTPSVRFESGIDWFDLDVVLSVDGQRVPMAAVLAAWRAGQRYVRLADGNVARMPDAWLEKHGESAAELADLRRARKKRLGAQHAAALADLLDEAPSDAAVAKWRETAERVQHFDTVAERPAPPDLEATLRDYQHRGFRWLAALSELGLGGVLADDMGLGKTMQALAWILEDRSRDPDAGAVLVIAPTSVVHTWIGEAERFAPTLNAHLHHGPNRGNLPTGLDMVVTSYALLRHDEDRLLARRWRAVILDEAQYIKNPGTTTAQIARRLDAQQRFALTGTPLENHLVELWSIFEFLMPGFFGSQRAFVDRFARPIQDHGDADALDRLRARIRPFLLRRLKREVASELPPRTEQILYCDLPKAQRRLYNSVRDIYRASVLKHIDEKGVGGAQLHVLEALTRLRQACCHSQLVPLPQAEGVEDSAKLELLSELVQSLMAEGRRALVFSQWPSFLALVRTRLEADGIEYLYLDGSTQKRGQLQAAWNDEDGPPLFLISIKAGGTGLTLTGADVVIHLDPWWNPAVENQATDRAHRIGQTKPVTIYKIVARDTAEEKVLALQARKQALFDATVDADRLTVDTLTRADIEAVFEDGPLTVAVDSTPPIERVAPEPTPSPAPAPVPERVKTSADPVSERLITQLFADRDAVSTAYVRETLGLGPSSVKRWLKEQTDAGRLERVGRGAKTRFQRVG